MCPPGQATRSPVRSPRTTCRCRPRRRRRPRRRQDAVVAGAPVATINSGPTQPVTASGTATFTFTADQSDATFRCKLTGTGQSATTFTPCTSPKTYTGLRGGNYLLTVHAVAADGTTVGLDDTYAWRIENCTNKASLCPVFSPDHYSVKSGATFNNPIGTTTARRRNLSHVIRTINSMPGYRVASQAVCDPKVYPSTIRITLYSATDMAFAKALVTASRRCVSVRILMNNHLGPSDTPSIAYMQKYLGSSVRTSAGTRRSFAVRCNSGCRGHGVLHTKMYLFDSALTAPGGVRISDTVMTGSSNMTSNAARVQWNDLYTVRSNPTLHSQYLWMFNRMSTGRAENKTFQFSTGPYQTTFAPFTPGTDPTLTALRSIHCVGAGAGTGIGGRTVVYINMHAWFGTRGYAFANQVRAMYDRGCYVKVLYSFMSRSVYKKLTAHTGSRMSARRTIFARHGINATLYSHFKMIAVSGYVGSNRSASVVWTGSNNFTNDGLRFDEVTMRISSRAALAQYRSQFAFITRTRTSGTYASFAEPIGGGRAVR